MTIMVDECTDVANKEQVSNNVGQFYLFDLVFLRNIINKINLKSNKRIGQVMSLIYILVLNIL